SRFTAKNVIFDDKANESSRFAANRARGNFEAANSFGVAQTYKSSLNGFAVYAAATQNAFQSSFQISSFTAIA
ncbi:MAG: hypothetical protein LBO72_00765, partial [Helicobacteraceae bacterium]|nr:hypothetical protein [Helicobacteraceae bacterium]